MTRLQTELSWKISQCRSLGWMAAEIEALFKRAIENNPNVTVKLINHLARTHHMCTYLIIDIIPLFDCMKNSNTIIRKRYVR